VWDGSGYGSDETVWGGEFLRITPDGFERIAHLREFHLPGGEKAVKEPRRVALSILQETYGQELRELDNLPTLKAFSDDERRLLVEMLERGVHCPRTTSAGRLFDAVASILGLRHVCRFEGQAAMELEFLTHEVTTDAEYSFDWVDGETRGRLDWTPMIRAIVADSRAGTAPRVVSTKFHNTLVEMMVRVAKASGEEKVALSGGCFQNRYLTERAVRRLTEEGFRPYWHQRVPPNDGGIALGQLVAVAREKSRSETRERQSVCA
jgi:hydrogenase maturation protein HypF